MQELHYEKCTNIAFFAPAITFVIFKLYEFTTVQKKLKCSGGFWGIWKTLPDTFLQLPNPIPQPATWHGLRGFQEEFSLNTKDKIRSTEEEHTTGSAATASPSERPGRRQVSRGNQPFSHWQVLNWTFWVPSAMYADANVWRVVFSAVGARQAVVPGQHTASHYSAGLHFQRCPMALWACKFPHPKAPLCLQSWFLLPPGSRPSPPLPISVPACPPSKKPLEKRSERSLFHLWKV